MGNPWLHIPATDYEGHMSSPHIAQQQFLAQTFQASLEKYDATSIALLGCTTGNGLEFVNSAVTQKVTTVDLNPEYLEILRQRHGQSVRGLEIVEADLASCDLADSSYSFIFAGLLFEYVKPEKLLPKIRNWLRPQGILVSILQLPSKTLTKVSESPYESLKSLGPIMNLVEPAQFKAVASSVGLVETEAKTVTLESGKPFFIGTYAKK
jgi:SAM-dependent methyltransferase